MNVQSFPCVSDEHPLQDHLLSKLTVFTWLALSPGRPEQWSWRVLLHVTVKQAFQDHLLSAMIIPTHSSSVSRIPEQSMCRVYHTFFCVSNHASTHITEQIWLPHCKYGPHSHYTKWAYRPHHICPYPPDYNQLLQICARNNMSLKCHICQLLQVHICDNCVTIYTHYEINVMNYVIRNTGIHTIHWYIHLYKYGCHIAYICPNALLLESTYRSHITAQIH